MKAIFSTLALTLLCLGVVLVGSLWMRSSPGSGDGLPHASGPPAPTPEEDATEVEQAGEAQVAAASLPEAPELAPVTRLTRDLRMVLGRGEEGDAARERELLGRLAAIGSEPALVAALTALEDPRSSLGGAANRIEQVFGDLRGRPILYQYALASLDNQLSQGSPSHPGAAAADSGELAAWFRLMARNGGESAAQLLREHLFAAVAAQRRAAARAVRHLGVEHAASFLPILLEGDELDVLPLLAESLASIPDPTLRKRLHRSALDSGVALDRRVLILVALGRWLDPAGIEAYLELYDRSDDVTLRSAVLDGLMRVAEGPHCSAVEIGALLEERVLAWIQSPDDSLAIQGARIAGGVRALHSIWTLETALRTRQAQGATGVLAASIGEALAAMDSD